MKRFKKSLASFLAVVLVLTTVPFVSMSVSASSEVDCSACNGTGKIVCPICDGNQKVTVECTNTDCKSGYIETECSVCNGKGTVYDEASDSDIQCTECENGVVKTECSVCNGTGSVEQDCTNCTDGKVECDNCGGKGKVVLKDDDSFAFEDVDSKTKTVEATYKTDLTVTKVATSQNNTTGEVTYESKNPQIATVDKDGKVTVKTVGEVEIEATIKENEEYDTATTSYKLVVSYAKTPDEPYSITTSESNDWYNDANGVVISAPEGYSISNNNGNMNNDTWASTYTISDNGYYNKGAIKLALKDNDTDEITDYFDVEEIKYDSKAPAVPTITYDKDLVVTEDDNTLYYGNNHKNIVEFSSNDENGTDVAVSGVDHFEYKLSENDETKTVKADDNGKAKITIDPQYKGEITDVVAVDVANNSSAARESDGTIVVVDTIAPDAEVKYPNVSRENKDANKLYYGQDVNSVEVTFAFTEDNFFSDDVNIYLNGTNLKDKDGNWDKNGTWNEKKFTYVFDTDMNDENCVEDGEYVFTVDYTDRSGNNYKYTGKTIIIDNTTPVISIDYSDYKQTTAKSESESAEENNDDPTTSNITVDGVTYYSKQQKATITIDEANFDVADVVPVVTAKDVNGNDIDGIDTSKIVDFIKTKENWKDVENSNKHTLELILGDDANYVIQIDYTDLANNKAKQLVSKATVDTTNPEIKIEYSKSVGKSILEAISFGLYRAKADVTVTVTSNISPIYSLTYSANVLDGASTINKGIDETILKYSDDYSNDDNMQWNTLELEDATDASDDEAETPKDKGKVVYKFSVEPQFKGFVKVNALNMAGNSTTVDESSTIVDEKNNIIGNGIIVDDIAPVISSVSLSSPNLILDSDYNSVAIDSDVFDQETTTTYTINPQNYDSSDVYYYNDDVEFKIAIDEANFKADATTIKVNGKEKTVNWSKNGDINKTSITLKGDGRYVITVDCADEVGNKMKNYQVQDIVIDTHSPEITKFDFSTAGYYYYVNEDGEYKEEYSENGNEGVIKTPDTSKQYDYYFTSDVVITVSATDDVTGKNCYSGVDDIILIAKEAGGDWVTVTEDSIKRNAVDGVEDGTATKTFTIAGPFKGSIYAVAIDRLGQYPTANGSVGTVNEDYAKLIKEIKGKGYIAPYDTVTEDTKQHKNTSNIQITVPSNSKNDTDNVEFEKDSKIYKSKIKEKVGSAKKETGDAADFASDAKVKLFSSNTNVKLSVEDTYSGIKEIEWYVIGRDDQDSQNNQSGKLTIDNNGNPSSDDWNVKRSDNHNLVTKATKTVTVKNNSNDIIVLVVLTDRSGNRSYDYNVLGIDKDAPVVSVTYSDNNVSNGESNYYNKGRTATISVKERNFDAESIVASIKNVDPSYTYCPDYSKITNRKKWTSDGNTNVPTYTYKISYAKDGKFAFSFKCTDFAGNKSNKVNDSFIIDLIKPVVKVSLNLTNSDVKNKIYFNQNRTATITVTEHNFNQSKFENLIKASLNGKSVEIPTVSGFTSNGDVWTATVTFSNDGDYELSFKDTDRAGNEYTVVDSDFSGTSPNKFTIDKTKPIISIEVNDKYSYKTVPTITVTEKDNNCSTITSELDGTIFKNGELTKTSATPANQTLVEDHHNSDYVVKYSTVEKDGFYTVTAVCEDMAGNKSDSVTKTFSKNEKGAVYTVSSKLDSVCDGIVNSKTFTETSDDVYVDEYSPVPIKDSDYYLNINSKKKDNYITRTQIKDSGNWYHYRYTLDNSKLTAEGEYAIYIRSTTKLSDGNSVVNNDSGSKGDNRINLGFVVDNTNPYVKITGLESHINNKTTTKDITLTVSDDNLKEIQILVVSAESRDALANSETETLIWRENAEDGVEAWTQVHEGDSSLVTVSKSLELGNSSTKYFNVIIKVVDEAGNVSCSADDYNKDDLFVDSNSRLSNIIEPDENGGVESSIKLTEITLSKNYAISQMIKDNQSIAILIFVIIGLVILLLILIPIIIKKRRKLDKADDEEID